MKKYLKRTGLAFLALLVLCSFSLTAKAKSETPLGMSCRTPMWEIPAVRASTFITVCTTSCTVLTYPNGKRSSSKSSRAFL